MLKKIRLVTAIALMLITQITSTHAQTDNPLGDSNPYLNALPAWQQTLTDYVDDHGRTDFKALTDNSATLASFVNAIEAVSPASNPELFDTRDKVLAYHVNAYNALAMKGIIDRGVPKNLSSLFKRASFFKFRKIVIGGKKTNLYDYENKVIRPLDEPRMHFVLNCMVRDCPRLPRQVFTPENLEAALQTATLEFFSKPLHLKKDEQAQTLYVSAILDFYTKDFVASGKKNDLIPYINQYLSEPVADNYKVKYIKYDWTVNQQPN